MIDRSKGNKRNWILVWEDGFCNFSACAAGIGMDNGAFSSFPQSAQEPGRGSDEDCEAMNPELFFKMSHEVYNYGEGLMGKVAADNSHKWVYREPVEHEISFFSPWHGSLDPHPRTWEAQFKSGIQTIAVVAVQEGVLQLGSTKKIMEDLNFVLQMQRRFNYLQSIPGVFVPHPMSFAGKKRSNGDGSPPSDRGHWIAVPDCDKLASNPHMSACSINQFLSPRIGQQLWRSSSDTIFLGVKRPSDTEPLSFNFNEYPYVNNGESFLHRPECPSPPKSLNTGLASPQSGGSPTLSNLLPSMSSLQALLSKLPSVTRTERDSNSCIGGAVPTPSGFDGTAGSSCRPPVSRVVVNKIADERAASLKPAAAGDNESAHRDAHMHLKSTSKTENEPLHDQKHGVTRAATSISSLSSRNSEVVSIEQASDDTEGHQNGTSHCKPDCHKSFCSSTFLDTFDNLADFSTLHDSLIEAGDSYNSFLSEIYR
ncbi:uncharacterized protein [Physcomitrium patens]